MCDLGQWNSPYLHLVICNSNIAIGRVFAAAVVGGSNRHQQSSARFEKRLSETLQHFAHDALSSTTAYHGTEYVTTRPCTPQFFNIGIFEQNWSKWRRHPVESPVPDLQAFWFSHECVEKNRIVETMHFTLCLPVYVTYFWSNARFKPIAKS